MTNLEDLPSSVLYHICYYVQSSDLLQLRGTSKKLYTNLIENEIEANIVWRNALAHDFSLKDEPFKTLTIETNSSISNTRSIFGCDLGNKKSVFITSNAFESWKHWSKANAIFHLDGFNSNEKINASYFLRAAEVWESIHEWCQSEESGIFGTKLLSTFESGVRRSQGRFPSTSNFKAIHAFEAIFAFCDGQTDLINKSIGNHIPELALFGGYSAYDHSNYTRLCSTADSKCLNSVISNDHAAISFNYNPRLMKWFDLDIHTGKFVLFTRQSNACPAFAVKDSNNISDKYDIGLLWMEEYKNRLMNGYLRINPSHLVHGMDQIPFPVLSSFPSDQSPLSTRKITKGIEVIASSIGALEIMTIIYSIRIRLLTPGEEGYLSSQDRGFDTCQLESRHWRFFDEDTNSIDEVSGEGVIGRYPLLREGGYRDDHLNRLSTLVTGVEESGTFRYQSCANVRAGRFQGKLKFIPGSLDRPTGEPFFVELGELHLRLYQDINY